MSNDYGQEPRRRKVTTMLTNALITISITLALYNNYYTVVCCATILLIILLHITCRQRIPPAIMSGTFCLDNNHACNGDGHRRPAVTQHLTPYDDNDEVTILLHPPTPLTPIKSEIRRNELRRITATHRIRAMTAEQPNHNYEDNYKVSRITTWRRRAA